MARLLQSVRRTLVSSTSEALINTLLLRNHHHDSKFVTSTTTTSLFQSRRYATKKKIAKSPLDANVIRILHNEIDYQYEYAPPHMPPTEFKLFTVHDRPGEGWMTMRGRYGNNEEIKIEATMFDGYVNVPRTGEDETGEDVHLHLSLLVDISKGNAAPELEFVCSAWPDSLEIQKVYVLHRDNMLARPYMGPDFTGLKGDVQKAFREFLEERGINDELSFFLHQYMMNKDRIELLRWLDTVKSFVEK